MTVCAGQHGCDHGLGICNAGRVVSLMSRLGVTEDELIERDGACPEGGLCETDDERDARERDWPTPHPATQDGWLCWKCAEPVVRASATS